MLPSKFLIIASIQNLAIIHKCILRVKITLRQIYYRCIKANGEYAHLVKI